MDSRIRKKFQRFEDLKKSSIFFTSDQCCAAEEPKLRIPAPFYLPQTWKITEEVFVNCFQLFIVLWTCDSPCRFRIPTRRLGALRWCCCVAPWSQCWGSVTFLCGCISGSPDLYLWLMDPDPGMTPFCSDFNSRMQKSYVFSLKIKNLLLKFCVIILFCSIISVRLTPYEKSEGSGSIPLKNGSGSGSGRPKNIRIIWIPNTAWSHRVIPWMSPGVFQWPIESTLEPLSPSLLEKLNKLTLNSRLYCTVSEQVFYDLIVILNF